MENCSHLFAELSAIKVAVYLIFGFVVVIAIATALRIYYFAKRLAQGQLDDEFKAEASDLLEKAKLDKLIEITTEKIEERPNHTYAHWYLARAYYLKTEWQRALEEFAVVGRLEPSWKEDYVDPFVQEIQAREERKET